MRPQMPWSDRKGKPKSLATPLMLTSLVDGFCMLLFYLILGARGEAPIEITNGIKLPEVKRAETVVSSPVISIKKDQYYFQKQLLTLEQLKARLLSQKAVFKDHKAVVEADRDTAYSSIEPVMALMSELDIEAIQLAVVAEDGQ